MALTNRWAVLALVFALRFAAAMHFQSVAAVAPLLRQELGFSFSQLGTLMGVFSVAGALLSLPSGMLGDRFGSKRSLLGGMALLVAGGLLFTSGGGYGSLMAARLVTGMGAILVTVQTQTLLNEQFAGRELATAFAIGALAFGLGVGIGMGVMSPLADLGGWRLAVHAATVVAAVGGGLAVVLLPESTRTATAGPSGPRRLWALSPRDGVLCAIAGFGQVGFVTGYILLLSFGPLVLIGAGHSVAAAGVMVSQVALMSLLSVPLGGFLIDRTGRKDTLIVGGALGAGASCLAFTLWPVPLLWLLLFGAMRGGVTGGVQSLPGEVLGPHNRGTGFGVYFTVHYLGLVVGPSLGGWLVDVTATPAAPVWLAVALYFSVPAALLAFRQTMRRWPAPAAAPQPAPEAP